MAATLQSDGSSATGKSTGGSPRNTANTQSSTLTKAVRLAPVEVSKALQDGEKFIKWMSYEDNKDSGGTPVTLRVDAKGFYLYWIDQNHEMDLLDIATIRDVRTGQYAKKPKDAKLRQIVTMGSQDTLEEKTVTVCYGSDFVNVNFVNFSCTKKEIAQAWTDELMKLAYNLTQLNGSATMFLQKAHTKLCLQTDKTGKIPVKNIIKHFAVSKDDRRRVEKALDVSGLPSGKGDTLALAKFQFEDFFNLYKNLTQRSEVEKIFDELVGTAKRRLMSTTQLVDFLNKTQRDPRLNEILYPYANPQRARDIIQEYEPNKFNAQKGQLSIDGFLRYLLSDDNLVMAINKIDLCDDMDQPLSHYFINSSHNTYLTGHQLTGKSSVEIYRQALLAGCRCVELDFWNGQKEEPNIVHGYTFVPEIIARDVLEAIAESAFKTSDYPLVLSFENHCNPRQQAKIANYCRNIFGDMLLDKPFDSYPLEPGVELPPPSMLRRKIIIKNKKKHHHHHKKNASISDAIVDNPDDKQGACGGATQPQIQHQQSIPTGNGDLPHHAPPLQQLRQSSKESTGSSDTDSSSDDESIATPAGPGGADSEKQQTKETEAGAEISALVNYVQPVHFSSFESSEKKCRYYEMSSFDEKQATTLLKERPIEFVNYNKHQLSRVYPAGTRFDSSNFMPQLFWNAGCQLVALNYQTLDLAMQLNLGIFEYNHRCGYILKPEFMRRTDRRLDPFAESTVDGIIAGTVSINVISGQFLSDKKTGTYVEVDMFGLPADTVRKKFRTKLVRDNGINPVYWDEPFVFKKVVLPELASIRIAAYEEGGKFIGHRVLPVIGLCPGYRHLMLRNELGQPIGAAALFLHIVVKDYVPDGLSDFAEALANPIKYQSELEKRSVQLAVLQEDTEPTDEENPCSTNNSAPAKKDVKQESSISSPKHRSSSITAASVNSVEYHHIDHPSSTTTDGGGEKISPGVSQTSASAATTYSSATTGMSSGNAGISISFQQQQSIDQGGTLTRQAATDSLSNEADAIVAEPLEKILENKLIKEKRDALEKKLKTLRKTHDKEKVKAATEGVDGNVKRSKFSMGIVKRISSKNIDVSPIPPCVDPNTESATNERLQAICRDHSNTYRDTLEKYHESIYNLAEEIVRKSQERQMKQLKTLLERETSDVMRQLQMSRKNEVKQLVLVHKDKDELERMKREVDSTLVDKGVAERVRLTQAFEKRRDELTRQHESVKNSLKDFRTKAKAILDKETDSGACILSDTCLSNLLLSTANISGASSSHHETNASSANAASNNHKMDL
ncbi:1-phosphatidylinositol 4,5-bisphosphate phosphodiesterase classes I and II isoform X2 [Culicoides brevitarsis]|uniref:1-phosphatidylinositol 4,5-bisphosphate phosphodiesterase classes I and II isoform X2 n=1 Tax=Culicoides brevitarsis TaxID=469753 RepID=UPI00307B3081